MSQSNRGKEIDRTPHQQSTQDNEEGVDSDDWKAVKDPQKRRQIQNRLAQRRYREKVKTKKEDLAQHSQDRAAAGNAYSKLDPRDLESSSEDSGVPWGSFNMKHIVERGRAREQDVLQQRSREASAYLTQTSMQGLQSTAGYQGTDYSGVQDFSLHYQEQDSPRRSQSNPSYTGEAYNAREGYSGSKRGPGSYNGG